MESGNALSSLIGRRIAQRRAALGQTLDQVASRTGVSRAMISRIERGEVDASAVILDRLCGGLYVSLSTLVERDAAAPVLCRADQPVWQDPESGYRHREVAPTGTGSAVRIVEIEFPAGASVLFARQPGRALDQHVWVLEGEIEVESRGCVYTLRTGDCLHMNGAEGNGFRNRTDRPVRCAVILKREDMP
jgi:transcriptional regulator with XRE-family HTH domain